MEAKLSARHSSARDAAQRETRRQTPLPKVGHPGASKIQVELLQGLWQRLKGSSRTAAGTLAATASDPAPRSRSPWGLEVQTELLQGLWQRLRQTLHPAIGHHGVLDQSTRRVEAVQMQRGENCRQTPLPKVGHLGE